MGGNFTDTLTAAETLWKQGDHDGAWLALEELRPIDRVMPEVIDLRLRILTCLCKWGLGDNLASVLRFAGEDDDDAQRYKITVAEYCHARARALCADGDIDGAKQRVRMAGELWATSRSPPPVGAAAGSTAVLKSGSASIFLPLSKPKTLSHAPLPPELWIRLYS